MYSGCVLVGAHVHCGGQRASCGCWFFLFIMWIQGLNSGCQFWQQAPPPPLPAELTGSRTVIHSLIVQEVLTDHFLGMMKVQDSVLTLSGVTDLWSADDLVTLKWQGHVIMRDSVLHHILILAT